MDLAVLEWITANRPECLDSFFLTVTKFGSEYLPILLLAVVFWCLDRKSSTRVLLTVMFALVLNQFLKLVFIAMRPWLRSDKIIPLEAALSDATGYSFPSGHTANITACAGGLSSLRIKKWIKAFSWIIVGLVAASRLYLCVHTPQDVFFGFLSSLLVIIAVKRLCVCIERKPERILHISVFSIICVIAVVALAYIRPENGTASRDDVLKLSGACGGAVISWYLSCRFIPFKPSNGVKSCLLRIIPGLLILFAVLEGTKPLFTAILGSTAGGCVRYCLTTFCAFTVWPYIFNKAGL